MPYKVPNAEQLQEREREREREREKERERDHNNHSYHLLLYYLTPHHSY